jgi:hypothetical protein
MSNTPSISSQRHLSPINPTTQIIIVRWATGLDDLHDAALRLLD